MQSKTFSEEQIVQILREAETGTTPIGDLCRLHGISETTFAPRAPEWRKKYAGADVSSSKRLRELE